MRRTIAVSCPVCEFGLRGSSHEGFRCVRCHATYSTSFVRQLRREQLRSMIETHFGVQAHKRDVVLEHAVARHVEIEESRLVFEDAHADVERAVQQAQDSAQERAEQLLGQPEEEFLDLSAIIAREQSSPDRIVPLEENPELHPHDTRLDMHSPMYDVEDIVTQHTLAFAAEPPIPLPLATQRAAKYKVAIARRKSLVQKQLRRTQARKSVKAKSTRTNVTKKKKSSTRRQR